MTWLRALLRRLRDRLPPLAFCEECCEPLDAMVHGNTKGATARYALAKALGLNVADLFEGDRPAPAAA